MRDEPPCSGVASASASWRVRDTKVAEAIASGIQLSEALTSDGAATFRHACRMDLEGIASKPIGSRYVSGRTRAWLKPGFRAAVSWALNPLPLIGGTIA